jgi:alpha-L-rhamnosidase
MAFTFQKNEDIQFCHDIELLKKAEVFKPLMHYEIKDEYNLVSLIEDPSKLEGWTTKDIYEHLQEKQLKKGNSVILDFENHHVGYFSMYLESVGSPMDAPLYIRLRFAQVPCELKYESSQYNGWLASGWIQEEFIHVDELPCDLTLPRRYAFRYVEITVLDTSPKWQLVISNPQIKTKGSANLNTLKNKSIADADLQKIYDVGVKTLQDCMSDVFEDGPKRDRRLWLGDLKMQALANYESFDQVDLVKRCLYLFAGVRQTNGRISANLFTKPRIIADDTFLFDYSLFFIGTLYDLLKAHYEQEVLADLFPIAKTQMDISLEYVNEEGCFIESEAYPLFIDWNEDLQKDVCGQAIMILSLRQFIELCTWMNEDSTRYKEMLEKMSSYALGHLYSQEEGLFVCKDGNINIASQTWMVLAHVLEDAQNKELMQKSIKKLFPIKNVATPYMYSYITEALFEAGLKSEAIQFMKSYWKKMIDLGADTYWEAFMPENPSFSPYGHPMISSYCHAWGCAPVYLIPKYCPELLIHS